MPTPASSMFPTCREEAPTRSTRRISTCRLTSSWSFGSPTTTSSRRHSSVMTPRPSCSLRPNRTGRSSSNESSTSCPTCRRGSWRSPSCPLQALTMSARSSARASTGSSSSREAWPTSSATRRPTSSTKGLLEPATPPRIPFDHEGDPRLGRQHVDARPSSRTRRSAPRLAEKGFCHVVPLRRHGLQLGGRVLERHLDDPVALQRRHLAEPLLVRKVGRLQPEPGGEHAVARGGGAAALDVAEHRHAGFEAGPLLDLAPQRVTDAAL